MKTERLEPQMTQSTPQGQMNADGSLLPSGGILNADEDGKGRMNTDKTGYTENTTPMGCYGKGVRRWVGAELQRDGCMISK